MMGAYQHKIYAVGTSGYFEGTSGRIVIGLQGFASQIQNKGKSPSLPLALWPIDFIVHVEMAWILAT